MLDTSVAVALIVTLCICGWTAFAGGVRSLNLFVASLFIFIVFVVPKAILFALYGAPIFLTEPGLIRPAAFNAAMLVVCAFQIGIALVYLVAARAGPPDPRGGEERGAAISPMAERAMLALLIVSTLLAVAFTVYTWTLTGHLFQKVIGASRLSLWYWLQKACQISKIGLYIAAIYLLRGVRFERASILCLIGLSAFALLTFVVSGQRSGIFILALQAILVLILLNRLKRWHLAAAAAVFVPISTFIVLLRTPTETSNSVVVNLLRRYFFEPEKIAGIVAVSEPDKAYVGSPWGVLSSLPHHDYVVGLMDSQLGRVAFHSRSAVPPSIVGETLYFGGGISIVPVAVALAMFFIAIERQMVTSVDAGAKMAFVTIAATGYFLLLNSSVEAFALRCFMELFFLVVAVAIVRLSDHRLALQREWRAQPAESP